ncbi:MAG: DUF4145 domain-containing protein [Deltaproteobacteria bacterium]|nr:DUF4145 domain-containing protein [Deltaproteobacteria bacterium]
MKIPLIHIKTENRANVTLRCPHCGHLGTFLAVGGANVKDISTDIEGKLHILGHRKCPNRNCAGHIFFITTDQNDFLISFPPVIFEFEDKDIPDNIIKNFRQAITCHAHGCFQAAGIMIRRTLEELCHERGAKGDNLKERISNLQKAVILPPSLFAGIDRLRLLGNDCAHLGAKDYDQIGRDEIETSLELTTEILKAVYQYEGLIKKLDSFKKAKSP